MYGKVRFSWKYVVKTVISVELTHTNKFCAVRYFICNTHLGLSIQEIKKLHDVKRLAF